MKDRDIDDILQRAAGPPPEVDPALLERISSSIAPTVQPVRPLPRVSLLAFGLFMICSFVAIAGAALLGFHGIQKMSAAEIAVLFPVLGGLIWFAAISSVASMTPGSAWRIPARLLPVCFSAALIAVFTLLFDDYRTDRFVPQGIVCLRAGLLFAIPAGLGSWLLLRRGYAVSRGAAGLVMGTLASLAGVGMLELHCANFQIAHIAVWHTAVVPLSALAGGLLSQINFGERLRNR